jgi:hypothetical protein
MQTVLTRRIQLARQLDADQAAANKARQRTSRSRT